MKNLNIINLVEKTVNDADHSFLSYNSPVEEAVKLQRPKY